MAKTPVRKTKTKSKFLKTSQQITLKKQVAGYDGAVNSFNRVNRSFLTTFSLDEDSLIGSYESERIRLESKDLFRNGIGKACVDRFSTYVVGTGFNLQAQTSNKEWNKKSEKWFNNWTKICDVTKRRTWQEILQTIVRDRLLVGESFFVLTSDGYLQPIEAERICSPEPARDFKDRKIVQGIELVAGITVAYYICNRTRAGNIDKTKHTRVDASNMVHVGACWRWDAVRSIAELSPILDTLRDKSEFTTSTIISAKIAARKSLLITSEGDMPTTLPARDSDNSSSSSGTIETRTKMVKTSDGDITYAAPGDKIATIKQEVPSSTYTSFTKSILGEVAAILGISYEILMLELSKTDEVGLKVACQTFEIYQKWLKEKFIERIWNWRIAKAVKARELPVPPLDNGVSEWYKVNIINPPNPFIKDQSVNDIAGFNLGTVSITAIAKRKGMEAEDLLAEKTENMSTAIVLAEELNKKHKGLNITWRDIINASSNTPSLAATQIDADQNAIGKPNE